MSKKSPDVRALARARTRSVIDVLNDIMNNPKSPPEARLAAAQALIEQGWGKPAGAGGGDKPGRPRRRAIFRRIIVEPKR